MSACSLSSSPCSSGLSSPKRVLKSCLSSQIEETDKLFRDKVILRAQEDRIIRVIPSGKATVSLLAKVIDHVDMLLEDWYPDIGIR